MYSTVKTEVCARALEVAESLQALLEERLLGRTVDRRKCGCCEYAKVTGIYKPNLHEYQIASSLLWRCSMQDQCGKLWFQGIDALIPLTEIFPMFRNAFAGIDVRVHHPSAFVYEDQPHAVFGDSARKEGRRFTGSGRIVDVDGETQAYVRPIGDLTQSVWVNAELRIDSNMPQYGSQLLFACNVNFLEFGVSYNRGQCRYYDATEPARMRTAYILIPDGVGPRNRYLPIARLVDIDEATGKGKFELDQSVEAFDPPVKAA